jgi:hypothetical protein
MRSWQPVLSTEQPNAAAAGPELRGGSGENNVLICNRPLLDGVRFPCASISLLVKYSHSDQ